MEQLVAHSRHGVLKGTVEPKGVGIKPGWSNPHDVELHKTYFRANIA
jgi:hypothetical protein